MILKSKHLFKGIIVFYYLIKIPQFLCKFLSEQKSWVEPTISVRPKFNNTRNLGPPISRSYSTWRLFRTSTVPFLQCWTPYAILFICNSTINGEYSWLNWIRGFKTRIQRCLTNSIKCYISEFKCYKFSIACYNTNLSIAF